MADPPPWQLAAVGVAGRRGDSALHLQNKAQLSARRRRTGTAMTIARGLTWLELLGQQQLAMGCEQLLVVVVEIVTLHDLRDDRLRSVGPSHASVPANSSRPERAEVAFLARGASPPRGVLSRHSRVREAAAGNRTRCGF